MLFKFKISKKKLELNKAKYRENQIRIYPYYIHI
jgi:hypothetical protein